MLLEVKNAAVERDNRRIVQFANLNIKEGEVHTLIGLNGAGKSTLAYAIMGIIPLSDGKIIFKGEDITGLSISERAKKGITLAWQEPARFEGITVREYLRISNRYGNGDAIKEALELVSLDPEKYLDRELGEGLSGGERKRIELAAVYLMKPELAILDEPDSGIDMLSIYDVIGLIKTINSRGTAVLLITHRDEMAEIADRSTLMCAGTPVVTDTPVKVSKIFRERCKKCDERDYKAKGEECE
jgi:Fe-S cluster assembly ATP-binding protein